MRPDAFLAAIEARQAGYAKSALTHPAGTDAHAYGRAIGHYNGLEEAKNIWTSLLRDEAEKDKRL